MLNEIPAVLSPKAEQQMEVIKSIFLEGDDRSYGAKIADAAAKLGKCERTIRRLVKKWRDDGLVGLTQIGRSDKGSSRLDEDWQKFILKSYKEGNQGSKRITRKQVAVMVTVRAEELKVKPPSQMSVYRILNPVIDRQEKQKKVRSPGWRGSRLSLKTREGESIVIDRSNQTWQCDHSLADILLVDSYGKLLGRPWLTTVIDCYSRCIMGINLSYDPPSSQVVSLALRHAILPKRYGSEYKLHENWGTYGLPDNFYSDNGKDFRSKHLEQIGVQLGFACHFRDRPSEGGIVERPFKTFNTEFFSSLQGYTASNVQDRPKTAEKDACFTLRELEELLVRYIVDNYNQRIDARIGDQCRFQRWEAGLGDKVPELLPERELDICLMKQAKRTIQSGGHIQFANLIYRGETLAAYGGDQIVIRFDPRDITQILAYRRVGERDVFLAHADAAHLEMEKISLDEAKACSRRLREAGKLLTNRSILAEVRDRREIVKRKPTKKERYKTEKETLRLDSVSQPEENLEELDSPPVEWKMPEVYDFDEMLQNFEF
jgi:putative transposase